MTRDTYQELYALQDKVLEQVFKEPGGFYLSGGTALSRFHLGHRYSDDLDFFTGDVGLFPDTFRLVLGNISTILPGINVEIDSRDFKRVIVQSDQTVLKLDFIADRLPRIGVPELRGSYRIDTVRNILSNKLCALLDRDEARDLADVLCIARSRMFVWHDVLSDAKRKQSFDLEDLVYRIDSFPLSMLDTVPYIDSRSSNVDLKYIKQLSIDISSELENSIAQLGALAL